MPEAARGGGDAWEGRKGGRASGGAEGLDAAAEVVKLKYDIAALQQQVGCLFLS